MSAPWVLPLAAEVLGTEATTVPMRITALLVIVLLAAAVLGGWETAIRSSPEEPGPD